MLRPTPTIDAARKRHPRVQKERETNEWRGMHRLTEAHGEERTGVLTRMNRPHLRGEFVSKNVRIGQLHHPFTYESLEPIVISIIL